MDHSLQTSIRALRETPGDPERAAAVRAALDRLSPEDAAPYRDALVGTFFSCESFVGQPGEKRLSLPRWRRCGDGLLPPRQPSQWRERWRVEGLLLGLTHSLAIVETASGSLEALRVSDGSRAWEIPTAIPGGSGGDERVERLPWALTPWGAAEVVALHEAPLEYRRVGRYHAELGRVTHKAAVGRGQDAVTLTLQLAAPHEEWSERPPRLLREEAAGGDPLAGAEVHVEEWEDTLLSLGLDPRTQTLALFAGDEDRAGQLFELTRDPFGLGALPYEVEAPFLPRGLGLGPAFPHWDCFGDLAPFLDGCVPRHMDAASQPVGVAVLFPLDGSALLVVDGDSLVAVG
jgi:hypothetical protein